MATHFLYSRRAFITLLGGAVAAWPLAARAQQRKLPVIGYLDIGSAETARENVKAFQLGLAETGFIEGRNVAFDFLGAEGRYDRLPGLAAELVRRQVTLIAALGGTPAPMAAKAATTTIPIVFRAGADPVAIGLVASLNRPGGNLTGVTSLNVELEPKRLELLHDVVPSASIIALLVNPSSPTVASITKSLQVAADRRGVQLVVQHAAKERDIDAAFANLPNLKAGGLIITPDPFLDTRKEQLVVLAARYGIPAISYSRVITALGGLMSYGDNIGEAYRLLGVYAGRILRGEKAADLPVQQMTKLDLAINLNTARALGIEMPPKLLAVADQVFE
jgi:putative tryptophan/tyrosine transport system substrate-binding protein